MPKCLAIDIGASSGRHIVGWQESGIWQTREVYRFPNGVKEENGHLVWDIRQLLREVKKGIAAAFCTFDDIKSLSVDTWGVDYVRLSGDRLCGPCFSYRDPRTFAAVEAVHKITPFEELYKRTGCQFQPFNTVYQLYDDNQKGRLEGISDILMIPEYLIFCLTGVKTHEYTNATTTGLVNAQAGAFDTELIGALGLPGHLFAKLRQPGAIVGRLTPEVAREVGGCCDVVLCATHDTASAVEGIPMEENAPYISSGTWSLLGVKTPGAITNCVSMQNNFTNEGGVGYIRYQKNIMGLWLVNELKRELCPEAEFSQVVDLAIESTCGLTVDANSPDFLSPKSMKLAFDKATDGGLSSVGDYFCCAYRSLALSYRDAVLALERNVLTHYSCIYLVGGGAKNGFLNRLTAEATGKQVIALPIEATALGNLKIQWEVLQ